MDCGQLGAVVLGVIGVSILVVVAWMIVSE
jgi:hypothetical protein